MKTLFERMCEANSLAEQEKICKEFVNELQETPKFKELLELSYEAYHNRVSRDDPYLVDLNNQLEQEKRAMLIDQGFYPKNYDFDKVLTEEQAKRAREWFGSNEDE